MGTFAKLLVVAGLGYGGYETWLHWTEVAAFLHIDELGPGKPRAIAICRKASTLQPTRSNGDLIDARIASRQIEPVGDLWTADHREFDLYIVHCCYREDDNLYTQDFEVHIDSGKVTALELMSGPPR